MSPSKELPPESAKNSDWSSFAPELLRNSVGFRSEQIMEDQKTMIVEKGLVTSKFEDVFPEL